MATIIQWYCRVLRANYDEVELLINKTTLLHYAYKSYKFLTPMTWTLRNHTYLLVIDHMVVQVFSSVRICLIVLYLQYFTAGCCLTSIYLPTYNTSFPGDFINMQKCSFGKHTRWNMQKAECDSYKLLCEDRLSYEKIGKWTNSIECFSSALLGVANDTVPKTSKQAHKRSAPWFNDSCKMAVAERKKSTIIVVKRQCARRSWSRSVQLLNNCKK